MAKSSKSTQSSQAEEKEPMTKEQEQSSTVENIISIVLGLAVVVVIGAMIFNTIRNRGNQPEVTPNAETTQTEEQVGPRSHTVAAGETLWIIAEKYYNDGHQWVEIQKANNLANADAIETGMTLVIPEVTPTQEVAMGPTGEPTQTPEITPQGEEPSPTTEPTVQPTAEPTSQPAEPSATPAAETKGGEALSAAAAGGQYTVTQGDSLWKIAIAKYNNGYRWVEIAKLNKLRNPNLIYVGATLQLPQ